MLSWFRRPLRHGKLRTKLFWHFILVSIVPLLSLGIYVYASTLNSLHTQMSNRVDDYANRTALQLDASYERCQDALDRIVYSDELVALLSQLQKGQVHIGEVRLFADEQLENLKLLSDAFRGVDLLLYGSLGSLYNTRELASMVEEVLLNQPQKALMLEQSGSLWFAQGDSLFIVRSVLDLYNELQMAYMVFTLDKRAFFQEAFFSSSGDIGIIVADESRAPVMVMTKNMMTTGVIPASFFDHAKNNLVSYNGSRYLFSASSPHVSDWTLYSIVSYTYVTQQTGDILMVTMAAMIGGAALILLISYLFSAGFTKRIECLIRQMRQVSSGNWSVETSDVQEDEIGQLNQAFEQMVEKLETLTRDVYGSQIAQRESEFKALQAQINPHFLYNCLDNMNWYAILRGDDHSSYVITQLSDYYRTALNRGKNTITVADELKNAIAYMNLQLELHDNCFKFETDIAEGLGDYVTIHLMLQPLLENAVKHGVDKAPNKNDNKLIRLTARRVEDTLRFEVFNTGIPFSPDLLESVFLEKTRGYGLRNVDERLRLLFGDAYGVKIRGVENGTLCTIIIPLQTSAEGSSELPEKKEETL